MKLISTSQTPILSFKKGQMSQKMRMPSNKIGWLHSLSDKPGAKFDIVIKDSLGRVKYQKSNCGNDTTQYGELVNLPTLIGEEVEVELENAKNFEELNLFLN